MFRFVLLCKFNGIGGRSKLAARTSPGGALSPNFGTGGRREDEKLTQRELEKK